MVGIVLVSHSHSLAVSTRDLALGVSGGKTPIAIAAGAGDDHTEFGTNAMEIMEAIQSVMSDEGVLILMDMGSALLSTETALSFLDDSMRAKVRCSGAPFIEGAVAACVVAGLGSSLEDVRREAEGALKQKSEHLQPSEEGASAVAPPTETPASGEPAKTVRVTVRNPHGLHARPAARFIREAAALESDVSVRNLTNARGPVSAKSLSGLASLEILQGNEIEIAASGPSAETSLKTLQEAVESGLGESVAGPAAPVAAPASKPVDSAPVAVSSGLAIGPLFFASAADVTVPDDVADDPEAEIQKLRAAIEIAKADLAKEEASLKASLGSAEAEIFQAQALVLDDPELLAGTEAAIRDNRQNAATAWYRSVQIIIEGYGRIEDEYLRQRAADVRDIGARVLEALGVPRPRVGDLPDRGILVVEDLTPAEVTALSDDVIGVVCLQGGTTSHAAILLRARGIPAIAHAQNAIERVGVDRSSPERIVAAFDGNTGELWVNPEPEKLASLRGLQEARSVAAEEEARHRHEPAATADGYAVSIFANIGRAAEATAAIEQGAEGVGLFRTEFLFLDRAAAPTEDEQYAALREVRDVMGKRPVVIRTLDIGGDKEVPYLGLAKEANPFLGVRGIRLCLSHLDLFETHLRAILRAGHGGDFHIMFPMIAEPAELDEAKAVLEQVHSALERDSIPHAWPIPIGIMIEVPSAAVLIEQLAARADFFSIGTNDLTQYVLAADRGNAELSRFHDALHPSVLRMIQQIVAAADRHGRHVAVCGEAASDPAAARILVGLGVDELSLSPVKIPTVKAAVRAATKSDLEALAVRAASGSSAPEARAIAMSAEV